MSASFGSDSGGEVELNIAPIVDCFTVLIAYMLVSASFITLGVLDVGVAASGEAVAVEEAPPPVPQDPPLNMMVMVGVGSGAKVAEIKVTGGKNNIEEIHPIGAKPDGTWDQEAIKAKVGEILSKHNQEKLEEANVTAEPDIEYRDIVQISQALKATPLKKVYLAGS